MLGIGLHMMCLQFDVRRTALLAGRQVAADNGSGPSGLLAFPMLAARVSVPVCVLWTEIPFAAHISAGL
jgi:hypothetical protein